MTADSKLAIGANVSVIDCLFVSGPLETFLGCTPSPALQP